MMNMLKVILFCEKEILRHDDVIGIIEKFFAIGKLYEYGFLKKKTYVCFITYLEMASSNYKF